MSNTLLITRIKQTEERLRNYLPKLSTEIDEIIQIKSKDTTRIEKTLDALIDFAYFKVGQEEFERLNRYYSNIHRENSEKYKQRYAEEIKY